MAADSRQPVKPLQFNSTTVGMSQISPHDSLAVGSSNSKGGTGYFLRFNDTERHDSSPVKKEYKPLPVVKKPAASPKKPIASPKRPITSPKKTNSSPKKITSKSKETMITGKTTPLSKTTSSPKKTPPPTASKPKGYTAKQFSASTSAMPRTPKVFNHSTSVTKANSNAKSTVTSPKKQGPAVKPKPDMKAKSKIPSARASGFTTRGRAAKPIVKDGFRTRSVSPKVLKKEDVLASQQYREETITYVADKCSQLLKNLETDREHISKSLPMPSSSLISFEFNSPTILTNGSIATATDSGSAETDAAHFVNIETPVLSAVISYSNGPHLGSEVNTDEMDTKEAVSADIPTNTSPIADTDEKEKPIEEITSVQATNDIANDSPAASGSSQPIIFENLNKRTNNYSNNNSSDGSDSGETSRLVEARVFIDLDENNQVNNLPAHCPKDSDSELTSLKGAQEAEVEDSLNRVGDTSQASDGSVLPSCTSTTPLFSDFPREDTEQSSAGCQESRNLTNSRGKNLIVALAEKYSNGENEPERDSNIGDGSVTGDSVTVQSPEIEEEKTELVNRQRETEYEQEVPTVRNTMASSWMDRLKEDLDNDDEWLSDEEEEFQREQEAKLQAAQKRALAETESLSDEDQTPEQYQQRFEQKFDKEDDWSDEDVGFQGRNAPLRKSMNRASYSADESSEEEIMITSAPQQHQEPGREEMDMMVKKNLAYVNSNDLDQMDIMTSDLDIPESQLKLPDGVGEFVQAGDESYDYEKTHDMEAKEDSDNEDHPEAVGSLEVVGNSVIVADVKEVPSYSENVDRYTEENSHIARLDSDDQAASRTELISALAEDLKESDQSDMTSKVETVGSGIIEEDVSPTNKHEEETKVDAATLEGLPNTADDSRDRPHFNEDYSTQVIRPNRKSGWRRQLSEKLNEWEDELPSPSRPSGDFAVGSEAITSFMSGDEVEEREVNPSTDAGHIPVEKTKTTEVEIREKVEDSMHDKIRDWKNRTAESVAGQVDEWQSLGNFNIPNPSHEAPQGRRRAHEDAVEDNMPAEKRRDLDAMQGAVDDNAVLVQSISYDGDAEGADEREDDKARADDSDDEMEGDGEGYISESSSQDTVRERSLHRQSLPINTGSLSDDESLESPAAEIPLPDTADESGYVEILGGEEPPDEWMNLGTRRERVSSSSSSSDGSGFQFVSAEVANQRQHDRQSAAEEQLQQLGGQRVSDVPRQRLSTPPLDLPVATHPPVEDIIQETAYSERQYSMPRDSEVKPVKSVKEKETVEYDRMPTEPMSPMSHSPGEVLTDDEEVTEVASHQRIEELAQPELAAAPVEEAPVQKPRRESPKSDDPPEVVHKDAVVGRDEQAPQPTTRKDSYDRVEKLRKEMRTASSSGQTQSFDVQMTRQGRTAERFTERMMSFEKSKAMREKKTLAPPGLSGKFSSVFSRFETDDGSRAKRPQRQDIRRSKSTGPPARRNRDRSVESPETVQPTRVNTESSQPRRSQVLTRSKSQSREGEKSRLPERRESVEERRPEPRAKRIERSKTFDTGIPNRSPSGRKVIERMAKFGDASDARKSHQETVTTRNSGNERYDMTADGLRPKSSQPHFDVDIQIRREPDESDYHKRRSARRDKVRAASEERREEYLNVWDTEVPVRDEKRKVISPKRLHVTSVSRTIRPSTAQDQTRDELPISSSSSEPKIRQKSPTLQHEEVSVTVRPQQAVTQSSAPRRSRDTQAAKVEQSRMRSSIALRPTDDIIQPKQTSRQNAEPQRKSRAPERDRPWKKADSLEDLRSGSLVAQCKGKFDTGHSHPYQFLPGENKAFSNRRNEPSYTRGGSERQETMSDAVRDLTDAYDQMEDAEDYDIGYSRESLEYTRKWIENNETTPDMRQSPDVIQPPGRDRVADPRRDDANYRRMQRGNIRDVPKHYIMPSRAAVEPASPEPSVVSERGRARSMEGNRSASTGRPKGRSRSVPRKKPAKAIADRASVFSNPSDEPPMTRPDIEEHIKAASSGRFMQGNPSSRRSASPRPVTQKERLANRRSMPPPTELIQQQRQPSGRQQREPTEEEQRSPRAASKGVAMMIELYNKNKARDSALADVDEQTLASVDDDMFRHSSMPTSPPVDQTPAAAQAWKAWRGQVDRSGLEQKIEHAYSRHTQPAGPPVKRESKPLVSGWQQRSVLEERLVHPVSASQSYSAQPAQHSPPRPAKSNVAMDAQRKGWSTSPPAPAIPHRGYSAEPEHSGVYNGGQPADNAFDSYKQQTLQRFRQEEQYATVQRASRPEPPRQLPVQAPNTFDQALLMQAPPPKPERLYNKAEPWEAYPPNEYLTTNQLQGYQQRPPAQQPNDMRVPARYADERPQYAGYPSDRPASQRDPRYRDHPPPPQQQRPHPVPQARYDDRGYPAQPMHQAYREPDYPPPPKQNYPTAQSYREPGHDSRPYGPGREPYHHGYGDQPDGYRPAVRKEVRYPHEQPPRGPIPDPRYGQSNGIRSPPPQQANPRYGAFDPRMETGGRPPRRTNSVPNIKQQVTSPSKPPAPLHPYNPRYHDQYIEERQRQQTNAQHESLPRSSKKDKSSKKNKEKSSLPEFIPIQYATGKQASKAAPQNGYSGHPKYVQNNNYPPGNNRYTHPSEQGYTHNGYPPSGHPYPSNGHPDYPPRHGYHPGAHHGYHHDDPYAQRTRPGVGVIYNPDLGVSDF